MPLGGYLPYIVGEIHQLRRRTVLDEHQLHGTRVDDRGGTAVLERKLDRTLRIGAQGRNIDVSLAQPQAIAQSLADVRDAAIRRPPFNKVIGRIEFEIGIVIVIEALDGIIRSCVGKVSARILRILIGECSIKMGFRKINSINRGRFSADSQVG